MGQLMKLARNTRHSPEYGDFQFYNQPTYISEKC